MRTVDNKANPDEARWEKFKRDLALALQLCGMTVYYWTAGRKFRSMYRRCEERGETYYVDDDPAETERRLR